MKGRHLAPTEPGEFWISLPALAGWLRAAFENVKRCEECQGRACVPCPECRGGRGLCECDCGEISHEVTCDVCDGDGSAPCLVCNAKGPSVQIVEIVGVAIDRDILLNALERQSDHLVRARALGNSLRLRGRSFRIVVPPVRLSEHTEILATHAWAHEQMPLPLRAS